MLELVDLSEEERKLFVRWFRYVGGVPERILAHGSFVEVKGNLTVLDVRVLPDEKLPSELADVEGNLVVFKLRHEIPGDWRKFDDNRNSSL